MNDNNKIITNGEINFEESLVFEDVNILKKIVGVKDNNIKEIRENFEIVIMFRNNEIKLVGSQKNVGIVKSLLDDLIGEIDNEGDISTQKLHYFIDMHKKNNGIVFSKSLNQTIVTAANGRTIKPKTVGQKRYCEMIEKKDVTFGIGPAGTGKTYLAVAEAVKAYRNKEVERIILTRPAVEAGEKLGFLPGDLQDKIDPYLRPLYDALFDIFGIDNYVKLVEKNIIEVAPLAYMRGRTINSSFIILDEAQNTTHEQMKMFLTRLGYGSKAVITGDITQIDLPNGKKSGLKQAVRILNSIDDIGFMTFKKDDVVRHKLVKEIIGAYEKYDEEVNGKIKQV